jgi:23S rRNA pseudouridine1911/1915/1917 synthase
METQVLQARDDDAGVRIDAFLAQRLEISRARAQKILETATLNGKSVKAKITLRPGDSVEYTPEIIVDERPTLYSEEEIARWPLDIMWQDDHLLVLNKPRGLTVHPGAGEAGATLVDVLRANGIALSSVGPAERAGIVHRLDKDTSGVMLVAKTDAAHWKLAAAFEARQIRKRYFAICCGVPPLKGRIEAPIGRHPAQRKKMAVLAEGRPSVTEYEVTQKWAKYAALDVNLLTGPHPPNSRSSGVYSIIRSRATALTAACFAPSNPHPTKLHAWHSRSWMAKRFTRVICRSSTRFRAKRWTSRRRYRAKLRRL